MTDQVTSGFLKRLAMAGLALGIAGAVAACSSFPRPSMPRLPFLGSGEQVEEIVETEPADRLYNEGVVLANSGDFTHAAKKFEDVDRQHPYSDLARRAILMTAYAKFEARDYDGAVAAAQRGQGTAYDGYVLLGCVIRGETSHYDIVANESARAVMDLAVTHQLAVGNGILTVKTGEQARVRSDPKQKNKGGDAARAALAMIALRKCLAGLA